MTWVLIIAVHVGMLSVGNSNAITSVNGFTSRTTCESAAKQVNELMNGTTKSIKTACLEVK